MNRGWISVAAAIAISCAPAPKKTDSAVRTAAPTATAIPRAPVVSPGIPSPPRETFAGSYNLNQLRVGAAAVKMLDGNILLCGGMGENGLSLAGAEMFDTLKNTWQPLPSMSRSRTDHTGLLLNDGRVLVVGGRNTSGDVIREAEIFDPETWAWKEAGPMSSPRANPSVTLLIDGRVLVAGGQSVLPAGVRSPLRTAEIYDPARRKWSATGDMSSIRAGGFKAVRLGDGRVLVFGGLLEPWNPNKVSAAAEIYDPASRRWSPTASMISPRFSHEGVLLPDGRVMSVGGQVGRNYLASTEFYDPRTRQWTAGPQLGYPRSSPATLLNNRIVIAGGYGRGGALSTVEIYDTATDSWIFGPDMWSPRGGLSLVTIRERVMAIGGRHNNAIVGSSEYLSLPKFMDPSLYGRKLAYPVQRNFDGVPPEPAPVAKFGIKPDDIALVIGIEDYKNLPPAKYGQGDAHDMARTFIELGVPAENVVSLTGSKASLSGIKKYLEEWLPRKTKPRSRVYFYFSGHGAPDIGDGTPYLMPWDADAAFTKSTGYSISRVFDVLSKLPAKEVVVALDSCFSGVGDRSVLAPGLRPLVPVKAPAPSPRLSILTASEGNQAAGSDDVNRHGLFTFQLMRGLSGKADSDRDGHLTLQELHAFTLREVTVASRSDDREQTPTLSTPNPGLKLW